jgi:hypothetical protein
LKAWSAALAAATLIATRASVARADGAADRPPESISVNPSSCGDLPWAGAAWAELLRVELAADGTRVVVAPGGDPGAPGAPRVRLEPDGCDSSTRSATLTLEAGAERTERAVDLAQVEPRARARVLALAAVEMIHASRARLALARAGAGAPQELRLRVEIATISPSSQSPSSQTSEGERAPEHPPVAQSFALFATGEGRVFAQGSAGLFGARGGARLPLLGWTALVIDAGVLLGAARDPLGDVNATLASVGLGVLATGGTREIAFGVGPRVEVGLASFTGHAFAPTTIEASASSPLVLFSLSGAASFAIAGSWSGLFGLDVGTTLYSYGARADGRHVSDFAGPMLGSRLGLMWSAR